MIEIYGYHLSVYSWIARFALHEKGVTYRWIEVNPFQEVPPGYLEKHPFCRVPTVVDGSFVLYETSAITRYIDEAFEGPCFQPSAPKERARVNQIMSIVDSYVYWPLVRQVFSHGVLGPRLGRPMEPDEVAHGLQTSQGVLDALGQLTDSSGFLVGDGLTLADLHLAPMISYFSESQDGRTALGMRPNLQRWFAHMSRRSCFVETRPKLPRS